MELGLGYFCRLAQGWLGVRCCPNANPILIRLASLSAGDCQQLANIVEHERKS